MDRCRRELAHRTLFVFGLKLTVYHPLLLCAALLAPSLAAGTAVLTAALFSLGKQGIAGSRCEPMHAGAISEPDG